MSAPGGVIGEGDGLFLFDLAAWDAAGGADRAPDPVLLPQYLELGGR